MGVWGIVNSLVAEPVDVGDSRGDVSVLTGDLLSWPAWSWPATGATRLSHWLARLCASQALKPKADSPRFLAQHTMTFRGGMRTLFISSKKDSIPKPWLFLCMSSANANLSNAFPCHDAVHARRSHLK